MLKLILTIVLFLVYEMPIISHAAGIYDIRLRNVDKEKNEKFENVNANKINLLSDNIDQISAEYDIELLSILKKNTIIQEIQDRPPSYQQHYSAGAGRSSYIQFIGNNVIDAQILLEAEMDWNEIKADLNYSIIFLNKVNMWAKNLLDEYVDEHIDTNYVLSSHINSVSQPMRKHNLYENKGILSSMAFQKNTHYKNQDIYKIPLSYNEAVNSAYDNKNSDERNILSFIYLWEKYSDVIFGVLVIVIVWLITANLIKFITRAG